MDMNPNLKDSKDGGLNKKTPLSRNFETGVNASYGHIGSASVITNALIYIPPFYREWKTTIFSINNDLFHVNRKLSTAHA